jgi:hypothetical protein
MGSVKIGRSSSAAERLVTVPTGASGIDAVEAQLSPKVHAPMTSLRYAEERLQMIDYCE